MKRAASLLPLVAGLALGSGLVWAIQRARLSPAPASAAHASATTSASGASRLASGPRLILPPLLDEAEADAALEAYLALPPLSKDAPADEIRQRREHLDALLTLLPDSHFPRLLDTLATREGSPEGRLRRAALEIWTERDASAAAHWAFALVPGPGLNDRTRTSYIVLAALAWGSADFAAAYSWAGALPDESLRRDLLPRFLGQLAATDPHRAAALALVGDDAFVRAAQRAVFDAWATRDPAAALQNLGAAFVDLPNRPWSISNAFTKWIARDPAAALAWAAEHPAPPGEHHRDLITGISWNLANQHPEAVRPLMDLLLRDEARPDQLRSIRDIFGPWARNDSTAALAWLETIPDGGQRSDLIEHAMNYVQLGRPDDFMALVRRLPESPERDRRIADHFSNWAKKDPDVAIDWLAKQDQDDPAFVRAVGKIEGVLIASLAATDPDAALARWQAVPDNGRRLEFAEPLASAWAKSDPAAATRWFAAQFASADPNEALSHNSLWKLGQISAGWLARDPLGYFEWAQSLPAGSVRELALDGVNRSSLYSPHGGAFVEAPSRAAFAEKLAHIPDHSVRERALTAHLREWLRIDLHAARAWIESNDALSPEAAAQLIDQTDNSVY